LCHYIPPDILLVILVTTNSKTRWGPAPDFEFQPGKDYLEARPTRIMEKMNIRLDIESQRSPDVAALTFSSRASREAGELSSEKRRFIPLILYSCITSWYLF
jgi:hypothetical protein